MNRIKLILFGVVFTISYLHAQTNFKSGYVIKSVGDTLFGEIDYQGSIRMGKVCIFRSNKKGHIIKYAPDDIVGYRFKEGKFFVSRELNKKKVFLEFLINGRLNMYHYRDMSLDHYYFEKDGVPLTELPYQDEITKDTFGTAHSKKSTKYIGLLSYYLKDAPGLQSEITSIKIVDPSNLIKLAENYHKAVCDGERCIIYEKKLPAFKINIEVAGGVVKGLYDNNVTQTIKFQGGVIAHVWMPNISENIYFRSGLFYSTCQFFNYFYQTKIEEPVYNIPLQFEYIYPKGIIRPKISAGINLYVANATFTSILDNRVAYHDNSSYSIALKANIMAGINVKLTKSIFWSINYDLLFFTGLTTGLYVEL